MVKIKFKFHDSGDLCCRTLTQSSQHDATSRPHQESLNSHRHRTSNFPAPVLSWHPPMLACLLSSFLCIATWAIIDSSSIIPTYMQERALHVPLLINTEPTDLRSARPNLPADLGRPRIRDAIRRRLLARTKIASLEARGNFNDTTGLD